MQRRIGDVCWAEKGDRPRFYLEKWGIQINMQQIEPYEVLSLRSALAWGSLLFALGIAIGVWTWYTSASSLIWFLPTALAYVTAPAAISHWIYHDMCGIKDHCSFFCSSAFHYEKEVRRLILT